MKRLFYPAERPLDGTCPGCGGLLTHIYVTELIDTTLPFREGNVLESPRWICRRCWGVDDRTVFSSELTKNDTVARR
jgi:hypothetical protein